MLLKNYKLEIFNSECMPVPRPSVKFSSLRNSPIRRFLYWREINVPNHRPARLMNRSDPW